MSAAPLAGARRAGDRLPADRLRDSDDLGWSHALVRTYRDHRDASAFSTHPTEDLLLVVVRSGSGVVQVRRDGGWATGRYHPGSVGVTAPGASSTLRWRTTSPEPMVSTHVHLAGELLARTADALGTPPRLPDALELGDPFVAQALLALARGAEARSSALYAESLAQALASHLLTTLVTASTLQAPDRGLGPAALRQVDAFMHAHLAEPLSLTELAGVVHLSKHHFLREYRAATGTTPHRALTALRMDRAARLLDAGRAPGAVAALVGYRSPSRFAERFRRTYGVTPGVYQARQRGPTRRR